MAETCRRCSGKGDPSWSGCPGSAVVTLHGHKGRGLCRLWGPSPGLAAGHPPARAVLGLKAALPTLNTDENTVAQWHRAFSAKSCGKDPLNPGTWYSKCSQKCREETGPGNPHSDQKEAEEPPRTHTHAHVDTDGSVSALPAGQEVLLLGLYPCLGVWAAPSHACVTAAGSWGDLEWAELWPRWGQAMPNRVSIEQNCWF